MKKGNVFLTHHIPKKGIELLQENCETVEIFPGDRHITQQELIEHIKGKDALLPLLTDTIDKDVLSGSDLKIGRLQDNI